MSIRFSRVTTVANDQSCRFLVGGKPENQKDLDGWTAFEEQKAVLQPEDVVIAHIETYLYGEGEYCDATPEEIAYFYKRMQMRPDFLGARATFVDESTFVFRLNMYNQTEE